MIRKTLQVALSVCFGTVVPSLYAQSFINTYGGPLAQDGIGVIPHAGGFRVGTHVYLDDPPRHVAAILNSDLAGATISWPSIDQVQGTVFLHAMSGLPDGSFFLAGSVIAPEGHSHDGLLIRLAPDGNVDWVAHPVIAGDEHFLAVTSMPDGGAIVAGVRVIGNDHDVWTSRFDGAGAVIWSLAEGGVLDEEAYAIAMDGELVMLTGRQMNFGGTSDAWFAALSATGDLLWTTSWGEGGNEVGRAIVPMGNGTFIMAGSSNSQGPYDHTEQRIKEQVYLLAIDTNGDTLWTRTVGDTLFDHGAWCADRASNGDLLIGGQRSSVSGLSDVIVLRVSSDGNTIWQRAWDEGKEERLLALRALDDGFVATGRAMTDLGQQVLLLRKDANGD